MGSCSAFRAQNMNQVLNMIVTAIVTAIGIAIAALSLPVHKLKGMSSLAPALGLAGWNA